jgi:NADH-quinone oxidoreductase subunit L
MTLIITGVGFLIHVYSNGYMEHDKDYVRFFASMNLFVFAMLLLVLAGDLLLVFVGWEGVGLASYLLIGFWYNKSSAAQAAVKAFVVNRIGDCGFLIGLLLIFYTFKTSNIEEITVQALKDFALGNPLITLLTMLLFIGAIGKSAQLPLHVWLPDAMEGPTPVSALIHAATMVTAGVYLIVRMHTVFMLAPITMHFIAAIGAITSLFAALCAVAQTDLKRVLAYSTVSQLGLMFLACGVGAFYAAMFHLMNHAFMKGLLFLAAGNVVHMLHDTTDMRKMGGLHKQFKITHWLFLIGVLSMSGVPPLAAFFSKDLILEQDYLSGFHTFFYIALVASILTAFYLTRAYCLTFLGRSNLDTTQAKEVKEAPPVMLIPVAILAVLACISGFLGFSVAHIPLLEGFLLKVGIGDEHESSLISPETLMSIGGALLGVISAAIIYTRFTGRLGETVAFLKNAFYIDEIYDFLFVRPLKAVSRFIDRILEPKVFDGFLDLTSRVTGSIAAWFQQFQSGQLRSYVAWMAVGMVLLMSYLSFRK